MNDLERVARTIAGLYNNGIAPGVGAIVAVLHGDSKLPADIAKALAQRVLVEGRLYLDYYRGRLIKCEITPRGVVDGRLYDRDHGGGAMERAVEDGLTDPFYNVDWS